jgi:hypothetical protein
LDGEKLTSDEHIAAVSMFSWVSSFKLLSSEWTNFVSFNMPLDGTLSLFFSAIGDSFCKTSIPKGIPTYRQK